MKQITSEVARHHAAAGEAKTASIHIFRIQKEKEVINDEEKKTEENNANGIDRTIAINVPSIAISIVSNIENINELKSEKSGGSILERISPK